MMLSGDMQIVNDAELRHAIWEDGWERYYSAGPDDPDYIVLRLQPKFAQGWFQGHNFYFDL
jgi:general stress protein 26